MCGIQMIAYNIALHQSVLTSYQYVVQYVLSGLRVDSCGRRRLSRTPASWFLAKPRLRVQIVECGNLAVLSVRCRNGYVCTHTTKNTTTAPKLHSCRKAIRSQNSSIETDSSGTTHTDSLKVGKVALSLLLVGWLVPCSSILRRLADARTTVPEAVVRESISSPINHDFGSSGKYGMSSKLDGGEHQPKWKPCRGGGRGWWR